MQKTKMYKNEEEVTKSNKQRDEERINTKEKKMQIA